MITIMIVTEKSRDNELNAANLTALEKAGRRNWLAIFEGRKYCPVSQTYYDKVKEIYMMNMPR